MGGWVSQMETLSCGCKIRRNEDGSIDLIGGCDNSNCQVKTWLKEQGLAIQWFDSYD